ncbi:S-layer homology domain-containing protein [Candidatus Peregrinibacteria bacterium]|jgi:hypothetical protein|nr:S-layer homology domain-containing protein [Candidatus Peregrinibacteria bacterium]MBT4148669.1 S-layer homology domain-containing protein [Candidatus Peregrinibacteria bacterium]MBT4291396.1 S-layer homology domain-containing protein [bacterium]MBT4456000.1 S-layer homology domain-containing protein [Candidatus Peregrinibacteria bacterium]
MDSIRRAIATFSIVAILSSFVVSTASAASFGDVAADDYYYDAVESLVADGIVDPGDTYNPATGLTRALAAKYLVMGAGWEVTTHTEATFTDVPTTHPQFDLIETAVDHGFMNGYGGDLAGMFGPSDVVNRADFSKMAVAAFELPEYTPATATFSDVATDAYYFMSVETAAKYEVVSGYGGAMAGMFGPADTINRADGAMLVNNAQTADLTEDPADDGDDDDDDEPDTVYEGDLEVTLSDDSPDPDTLPNGATSVPVAKWDFTAGDGDAELDRLIVHTYGVTSLPTTHSLYIYDGVDRLTSGKSVNSSTNQVTFNNLGIEIEDGDTLTLTLKLDTGTVATSTEAAFELEDVDAVDAGDAEIDGDFPLRAGVWTLSTISAGTVLIEKNGTITSPKVGEDDVTIAKFKIGASVEAAEIEQIGLLITGTVSNDAVENLELYVSGEDDPIATVDGLNAKDLAVFVLDTPYDIVKGDTKSFTMKGDFNTGRSADTVLVYVDETTDIVAIGGTYGYGMAVTTNTATSGYDGVTNACTSAAGTCSYSVLEGGDVTVTSSGPSADDVGIGEDDVVLMNFSITSVSDITVKNLPIMLMTNGSGYGDDGLISDGLDDGATTTTGDAANYTDIKIINVDTGSTLMGPIDSDVLNTSAYAGTVADNTDDDGFYLFTDEFDMDAGEELNLALTVDVANLAGLATGTIYGAIQLGGTYPQMKDVNNKTVTNSSSLVPTASITGKTMTTALPSLTTALAAVPVAGATTQVKGQQDVEFVGITASCGAASDCKLTDIALVGYYDTDDDQVFAAGVETQYVNASVGSVWIVNGDGEEVAPAKAVQSDGAVTYDSLTYEMEAGETDIFYVMGDLSSNAVATDYVAFSMITAGISFEDDDGTTRTSTGAVNGTTDATTYVLMSAGGSLTIAVDASTAKEDIVIAGASDQEISKYKFTTTDEPFTVKSLSINARQAVAGTIEDIDAADLGAYDNNISSITISYVNSDGDTETKSGYLSSGTADFSGMDMFIDKDDDAVLTVYADLNTISNGATQAEYVDLNIAFNDFEALAESSGGTYNADKLDEDVAATSDLDFGTITWIDSAYDTDTETTTGALGASMALSIDTGTVTGLPVGTLLFIDAGATGAYVDTADSLFVTTAAWSTTVPTVTVLGNDDATLATGLNVYFALPGTGYLTAAKQMHVYETKPTVTLATDSPSGDVSMSSADTVFKFVVAANAQEKVQIRQESGTLRYDADTDNWATVGMAVSISTSVLAEGTASVTATEDAISADTDYAYYDTGAASAGLEGYASVSFWVKSTAAKASGDIQWCMDGATDMTAACDEVLEIGALTANTWTYVTLACSASVCGNSGTRYIGVNIEANPDNNNVIYIDDIRFHAATDINDKIRVTLASDASMTTTADNIRALLKEDGSTVAEGGINMSSASAGTIDFFPYTTDYTDIDIEKGASKTFSVVLNTSELITDQAGVDDKLTPSILLGTATNGTVSDGSFKWYDTNAQVTWLGKVSNSTFNGDTLKY